MKLWTRITICRSSAVRSLLLGAMKLVGCYDSMGGRVMLEGSEGCEAGTRNLVHLYERALAEAPQELVKLDEVLHGNGTLSPRFDHNFDLKQTLRATVRIEKSRQESFLRIPDRDLFLSESRSLI